MYRVGECETLPILWLGIFIVEMGVWNPIWFVEDMYRYVCFYDFLQVCCFLLFTLLEKWGKISFETNFEEKSGNTPLVWDVVDTHMEMKCCFFSFYEWSLWDDTLFAGICLRWCFMDCTTANQHERLPFGRVLFTCSRHHKQIQVILLFIYIYIVFPRLYCTLLCWYDVLLCDGWSCFFVSGIVII